MLRALPSLFAFAALSLVLAACGGSSSSDDASKQITDVITKGVTTQDANVVCKQTFAGSWVSQVYGSVAKCVSIEAENAKKDDPATTAEVSGIKVDGDSATAFVEVKGGTNDGARGAVTLTRQADGSGQAGVTGQGGAWRISDLSTAFLRSQFESSAKSDRDLPKDLKACVVETVTGLDDPAFRALALGSIGNQPKADADLQALVTKCIGQAGSSSSGGASGTSSETASVLRKQFEQGVTESLAKDGISEKAIACVKRELRSSISDEQIVSLIGKSGKQVPKSITTSTAAALAACDAVK